MAQSKVIVTTSTQAALGVAKQLQSTVFVGTSAHVMIFAGSYIRSSLHITTNSSGTLNQIRAIDPSRITPENLVEAHFPEFIQEDYPQMIAFAKAYFNYINRTEIGRVHTLKDIDKTSDDYINILRKEFAYNSIKFDFLSDIEFIRNSKLFYASRGSEESIKYLFKVMFNREIEVEYPGEEIFRPSDAVWRQEKSFKVVILGDSLGADSYIGKFVTITNDQGKKQTIEVVNAIDMTEKLISTDPSTLFEVFFREELYIDVQIGNYVTADGFTASIIPSLASVSVVSGGQKFRVGQIVELDSVAGSDGIGMITAVFPDGAIRNVKLIRFGKNYQSNFYASVSPEGVFTDVGASFITSGTADVNRAIEDATGGFNERGDILVSDYLLNNTLDGNSGIYVQAGYSGVYVSEFRERRVIVLEEDYSALLLCRVGPISTYQGKFLNQVGMPSNGSKLQDNNYYQEFSYVIKSDIDIEEYRRTVTTMAHPAGMKMFSEYSVNNTFSTEASMIESTVTTHTAGT